jgi:WD40 repeat protein
VELNGSEASQARAGLLDRMRDGITRAVRPGGQLRSGGPSALVSFLAAAAFAPFLVPLIGHGLGGVAEGEIGATLSQLGAVGGGYFADLLAKAAERTRRRSLAAGSAVTEEMIRDDLATVIREALDAPGEAGAGLRAEVSDILRRVDAVQAALAADRDNILVPGFAELGERMAEFRWVLGVLEARLAELRQMIAGQGADQRGKMRAAQASLDVITRLLQRVVAAQEDRDVSLPDGAPRSAGGQPAVSPTAPPYPGMQPFKSRDAKWFFGREELTAHLAGRLAEQIGARAPLFVLGPSGAGKSSLLRAGLIPALRRGELPVPGSRRWPPIVLERPGAQPLVALAKAMERRASSPGGPMPPANLDGDPAAVATALAARVLAARKAGGSAAVSPSRLVLVVDQFEDIFTQCTDEPLRLRFIRVLLALTQPSAGTRDERDALPGALVVLGMRADFYQDCAGIAELRTLLPDNQLVVGPLAEPDLRRAITCPAAAVDCAVEPGLTELMLSDIGLRPGSTGYQPGALPLLGYALRATWNRRDGRILTVAGYREAGGVHGAVAGEAERIYADFPPGTQAVTRRIMLRLVTVGPGTQLTRRRVGRAALVAGLDAPAAEVSVARFTEARLVTADADGVEITHEAFLDAWPRLREWIADDRAGLRLHRQLGEDARTWAQEDKDPGGLYRGSRLGNALQWRSAGDNEAELTALERGFLDASAAAQQAQHAAQEAERARERRQNRRLRLLAATLAVVLLAALASAGIAVGQRQQAVAQSNLAQSEALAAGSANVLTTNLSSADLDALAGWQSDHNADSRGALLSSEANPYLGSLPERSAAVTTALAISPHGQLLAAGEVPSSTDFSHGSVQLWDLATDRELAVMSGIGAVQSVAFSPGGTMLAAVTDSPEPNLRLWDVATHRQLPDPIHETDYSSALAFSPDGRILAVAAYPSRYGAGGQLLPPQDDPGVIDLWDLASHRLLYRLTGDSGAIESLAFSPDGRLLASGSLDGTARLWNVAAGTQQAVLSPGGEVDSVLFSPAGSRLATASTNGIQVWNVTSGTLDHTFTSGGLDSTQPMAFSATGEYLYVADTFEEIDRYDLVTMTLAGVPIRLQVPVGQMVSSPDGRTLVFGGQEGDLVQLGTGGRTFYQADDSALGAPAVSPDGRLVATGAADGMVQLWDEADPAKTRVLTGHLFRALDVAFSPDGQLLAAIDGYCTARIWDVTTGRQLAARAAGGGYRYAVPGYNTSRLVFSPDGKTMATYCSGSTQPGIYQDTATVWDTSTFQRVAAGHETSSVLAAGLAYSPDGRTLALDNGSGAVLFWDFRSHQVTGIIRTGQDSPLVIALSVDGKRLATGSPNGTIQLWSLPGRALVAHLGPGSSEVRYLAFSPGGRILAAAHEDSTVQLYDAADLQLSAVLSPPVAAVTGDGEPASATGVAFGHGGQTLVSTSTDGTAQVWDLRPADEVRAICNILRGPGFASQWRQLSSAPNPCRAG